jgi:hypothetical protein
MILIYINIYILIIIYYNMILKRISSFVYNIYVVILNNLHYSFVRIITRKLHGQGQKRRRRDARAGSEAHLVVNVVFDEVLRG